MAAGTSIVASVRDLKPTISERSGNELGLPFYLILAYMLLDFARPANPMGVPLLISIVLFIIWLTLPQKIWPPQIICLLVMLAVIAVMGPFAENNAAVFFGFRDMGVLFLCLSVPIMHFLNSMRKCIIFINCLIGLYVYVAIYAALHSGIGPGAQWDENDVALALNSAIPFAFVSMLSATTILKRSMFGAAFAIMVSGVIVTMSRGGFVALLPMLLYCFVLSPKKMQTLGVAFLLAISVALFAPDQYWEEVGSIATESSNEDANAGTGGLRRLFWAIAREMFYAHPLFGVGFDNFRYVSHLYQSEEVFQSLHRVIGGNVAHSLYFTVLAELGLAGTIVFALLVMYNFMDVGFIRREVKSCLSTIVVLSQNTKFKIQNRLMANERFRQKFQANAQAALLHDLEQLSLYAHALCASLIGFLVNAVFLTAFTYPHFWLLTALAVVFKVVAIEKIKESEKVFSLRDNPMVGSS